MLKDYIQKERAANERAEARTKDLFSGQSATPIGTESIKSKFSDVSGGSDFDGCKCEAPDDRDFCCRKCGKISKWLAPHRDKDFEQMLKKGGN